MSGLLRSLADLVWCLNLAVGLCCVLLDCVVIIQEQCPCVYERERGVRVDGFVGFWVCEEVFDEISVLELSAILLL